MQSCGNVNLSARSVLLRPALGTLFLRSYLNPGAHCDCISPLRLLLVKLCGHDDHVTLWDLSCP